MCWRGGVRHHSASNHRLCSPGKRGKGIAHTRSVASCTPPCLRVLRAQLSAGSGSVSAGVNPGLMCQWPGEFGPMQAISSPNNPPPIHHLHFVLYAVYNKSVGKAKTRTRKHLGPCSRFSGKSQQRHSLPSGQFLGQNVRRWSPGGKKAMRATGM